MELFLNSDSRIKTCSSNFCNKAIAVWDFKVHQNIPAPLSGKGLFSSVSIWTIPENAFLNNVSRYISMVFGILAAVSTTSSCFASGLVNSFVFIHLSVFWKLPLMNYFALYLRVFSQKDVFMILFMHVVFDWFSHSVTISSYFLCIFHLSIIFAIARYIRGFFSILVMHFSFSSFPLMS